MNEKRIMHNLDYLSDREIMNKEIFSIESEYKNVPMVTQGIHDFLSANGIGESVSNNFVLCLMEALNNVIKHAYKGEPGNSIEVVVDINNSIRIEIKDKGIGMEKFEIPDLDYDPTDIENLPEGGWDFLL